MTLLRALIYRLGFRPRPGSTWYSPSREYLAGIYDVPAGDVPAAWPSLGLLVEHAARGRKAVYAAPHLKLVGALDAALAIAEDISGDQVIRAYRSNGGQMLDFSGGGVLRLVDPGHGGLRRLSVDVVAVEGAAAGDLRVREDAYLAVIASPVGEVILP